MSEIDIKELYKIAIDTRNFEINLFWQRSNYFIALNTGIAVATFFKLSEKEVFRIPLAILGLAISCLWVCMNFGSRYWQVRWEHKVAELEKKISNEILFSADRNTTDKAVEQFLAANRSKDSLRTVYEELILLKPSVNQMMIGISIVFVIFWIFVSLYLCVTKNSLEYILQLIFHCVNTQVD